MWDESSGMRMMFCDGCAVVIGRSSFRVIGEPVMVTGRVRVLVGGGDGDESGLLQAAIDEAGGRG